MARRSPAQSGRPVSMADVAALVGVSQQTVSRVVNHVPNVSEATAEKVERAIAELGFRPNFAGRSLRTGRYKTVGLCVYDLSQAGNLQTLEGISAAARENGYAITLLTLEEGEGTSLSKVARRMATLPIDGLIVRVASMPDDFYEFEPAPDVSTVLLSMYSHPRCTTVESDQYACSTLALEHLAAYGHRQIRFVSGPADAIDSQYREAGWREGLEAMGVAPADPLTGDWGADSGYEIGARLAADRSMTAVYAANDSMALGVIEALRDAGLRVPEDVSVIGVDDSLTGTVPNNSLTTVRFDLGGVGRIAFESVLAGLDEGRGARTVRLSCELVERSSVANARPRA
ncbi:LacI family DNA-binding transcriptional regulator [Paratractidigestivibacter sp.]|uniref:LacI family DNA-binding transcriptional regulator n=1 Tax=Paratractidigestivibacter sp. TaxID=2847316 RepID=UPI002ACB0B12|nr:LacI family DNA-binding transcriptional regulator [Paratractidigestivibacter sp.]